MSNAIHTNDKDDKDDKNNVEKVETTGASSAIGALLASNIVAQSSYAWTPGSGSSSAGSNSSGESPTYTNALPPVPSSSSSPEDKTTPSTTGTTSEAPTTTAPQPSEGDKQSSEQEIPSLKKALKELSLAEDRMSQIQKALESVGSFQELQKAEAYVDDLRRAAQKVCPDSVDERSYLETISSNNSSAIQRLIEFYYLKDSPSGFLLRELVQAVKEVENLVEKRDSAPKPKDIAIDLKNKIPVLEDTSYMLRRKRLAVEISDALIQMEGLEPPVFREPKPPTMKSLESVLETAEGSGLDPKLLQEVRETLLNGLKPIEEKFEEYAECNQELEDVARELGLMWSTLGTMTEIESPMNVEHEQLQKQCQELYKEFSDLVYNLLKKLNGWDLRACPELHKAKLGLIEDCKSICREAAHQAEQDDITAASNDPKKEEARLIEEAIWGLFHGTRKTYDNLPGYSRGVVDTESRKQALLRLLQHSGAPISMIDDWAEWEQELRDEVADGAEQILVSNLKSYSSTRGYELVFEMLLDAKSDPKAHVKELVGKVLVGAGLHIEKLLLKDCESGQINVALASRLLSELDLRSKSKISEELDKLKSGFSDKYGPLLDSNPLEAFKYARDCATNFTDLLPELLKKIPEWFLKAKFSVQEAISIFNDVHLYSELEPIEAGLVTEIGKLIKEDLKGADLLFAEDFCRNYIQSVSNALAMEVMGKIDDVRWNFFNSEIVRLTNTSPVDAFYLWLSSGRPWSDLCRPLIDALQYAFKSGNVPLQRSLRFFKDVGSVAELKQYLPVYIEHMATEVEKQYELEAIADKALASTFATKWLGTVDKNRANALLEKLTS